MRTLLFAGTSVSASAIPECSQISRKSIENELSLHLHERVWQWNTDRLHTSACQRCRCQTVSARIGRIHARKETALLTKCLGSFHFMILTKGACTIRLSSFSLQRREKKKKDERCNEFG